MKSIIILLTALSSLMALSLDEALKRALEHSPLLKMAQSEITVAQSSKQEAYAAYHPTLAAGYTWQTLDKTTAFTFAPTHRYDLMATYNLFRGFADSATIDARDFEAKAAQFQRNAIEADLKLAVITAYSDCIKAQKQLETQKEEVASLQRQYNDTAVRFEQGMLSKNELLLIEVDKLRAEQALFVAKSSVKQHYALLRQLLGGALQEDEKVHEFDTQTPEPERFETLLQRSFENRSELKALEAIASSLLSQRDAVQGEYLPHVDLQGNYRINDQERLMGTNTIQPKEQMTGIVNVSWTLYAGLANIERRKSLLEQSRIQAYQYEQLKLEIRHQLTNAYEGYLIAQNAKDVAARALQSSQENFRITSDRHNYGQVDTLTLLKAQADLTNATNAYNNATYDLFIAHKTLLRISSI